MERDRIDEIVYPRKNIILRMWITACVVVAAVFLYTCWQDRFRAQCETDDIFFAVLGIEQDGRVVKNFSGESMPARLRKIGLDFRSGHAEALAKVATVLLDDEERGGEFSEVPVIWFFARGKNAETCDKAYESNGELFFTPENFCFSLVDENGFAVQLDPAIWTIFHSKTSDAICAMPALKTPPQRDFLLRIEVRDNNSQHWKKLGEFPLSQFVVENDEASADDLDEDADDDGGEDWVGGEEVGGDDNEVSGGNDGGGNNGVGGDNDADSHDDNPPAGTPATILPEVAEIRRIAVPSVCRFFSTSREDHGAFGEVDIALKMPRGSKIPASAWRVENVSLRAATVAAGETPAEKFANSNESSPLEHDVFHTNVRFLEEEDFETWSNGILRAPIAKTLFPQRGVKWEVSAVLVRADAFLPEEITEFEPLRITRSTTRKTFAGATFFIRAYFNRDYFRLLENGVPALILEVSGAADLRGDNAVFCQPYRVKTDTGDDLLAESVVVVKPGVYQYWFMPATTPRSLSVNFAITRPTTVSGVLEAEIKP